MKLSNRWGRAPQIEVTFGDKPLLDVLREAATGDAVQRTRAAARLLAAESTSMTHAILQALPHDQGAAEFMGEDSKLVDVLALFAAADGLAAAALREAYADHWRHLSPRIFAADASYMVASLFETTFNKPALTGTIAGPDRPCYESRDAAMALVEAYGPHEDFVDEVRAALDKETLPRMRERLAAFLVKIEGVARQKEIAKPSRSSRSPRRATKGRRSR